MYDVNGCGAVVLPSVWAPKTVVLVLLERIRTLAREGGFHQARRMPPASHQGSAGHWSVPGAKCHLVCARTAIAARRSLSHAHARSAASSCSATRSCVLLVMVVVPRPQASPPRNHNCAAQQHSRAPGGRQWRAPARRFSARAPPPHAPLRLHRASMCILRCGEASIVARPSAVET